MVDGIKVCVRMVSSSGNMWEIVAIPDDFDLSKGAVPYYELSNKLKVEQTDVDMLMMLYSIKVPIMDIPEIDRWIDGRKIYYLHRGIKSKGLYWI